MLSCSWHWKIPGMGNRRDFDSRERHSTIKVNQRRRLWLINKCRFANQGRKKKTQHVLPYPHSPVRPLFKRVRAAEDAWNSRNPEKVAPAYTTDSRWRNRAEFPNERAEIVQFLKRKWAKELDYRLIKELWTYEANRIAVRFAYEWHDDSGNWFRSYGNENCEFAGNGLMRLRFASINDLPIEESERKCHWPLDRRPDGHPELSDLGL
jgi:uncharacterized protein